MRKKMVSFFLAVLMAGTVMVSANAELPEFAGDQENTEIASESDEDMVPPEESEKEEVPEEPEQPENTEITDGMEDTEETESDEITAEPESDEAEVFVSEEETDTYPVIIESGEAEVVFRKDRDQLSEGTITREEYEAVYKSEHSFAAEELVEFYVFPDEGYRLTEVTAASDSGTVAMTRGEDESYQFSMPAETVRINIRTEQEILDPEEEDDMDSAGASKSDITVKRISSDFKLDSNYGFAYGFRTGKTKLTVQNGSTELLATLDKQFGLTYLRKGQACDLRIPSQGGYYVARYTNVGDYQGKQVDLRITVTGWKNPYLEKKGADGTYIIPSIVFYKNRIGANIIAVKRVYFRFDFLESGTDNVMNLKCHTTMQDIDNGQQVRFYEGIVGAGEPSRIYLTTNEYLSVSRAASYTDIKAASGTTETSDTKSWIQVDFQNQLYFSYYMGNSYGSSGGNSVLFVATPKVLGTYEIFDPQKRVGFRNEAYDKMAVHETADSSSYSPPLPTSAGKDMDYVISQRVLPGTYSAFKLIDKLDKCVTFQGATVVTGSGLDVTDKFNISQAQNNAVVFVAKDEFCNSDEFSNDVTYYFRIKIQVKDNWTIVNHTHHDGTDNWYICNIADRVLGSSTVETNKSWIKGNVTGTVYVKKVDENNQNMILEGAEFDLYQWNRDQQKYVYMKKLTYDPGQKRYSTGVLQRDRWNIGKFRIVETKAPEEYEGGWSKEFNLAQTGDGSVIIAPNASLALPVGEIQVIKEINEKDIVWAHGNPVFQITVAGTDMKGVSHTYVNYMEFKRNGYEREGSSAILKYTFSGIPVGTYTVSEGKTLRYRFKNIQALTSNVTVAGTTGTVLLSKDVLKAGVSFENEKTRYDGYSHTDVIKNVIPLKK